jgi:alkanesulfonate monooxygenase SsuD/methylene tetrahydromethanopterin reductase-like flavin-dependent oxidoreductase (luciferase family)
LLGAGCICSAAPMIDPRRIEFGLYLPQLQLDFPALCDRVQCAEALGYDTVWFYDHLYPPGTPDVPGFEGWTLVSALAARTERIRLGQLVLCNGFRHPALLAQMAITLDVISGGRLELGLGSGSNLAEFAEYGLPLPDLATRSEQLDEALAIIALLCAQPRSSFAGRHYQLKEAPSPLRPVQRPHPRITVGGGGERRTFPIVARRADVWNCPTYSLAEIERKRDAMRRECERQGRDPQTLVFAQQAVVVLVDRESELEGALRTARRRFGAEGWGLDAGGLVGTAAQVIEQIARKVELGFTQFALFFHDRAQRESLDRFAREVVPAFR